MSGLPHRWVCPRCTANNMIDAVACFRCHTPRPAAATTPAPSPSPPQPIAPQASAPPTANAGVVNPGPPHHQSSLLADVWHRILGYIAKWAEAGSRGQAINIGLWLVPLIMATLGLSAVSTFVSVLIRNPLEALFNLLFVPLLPVGLVLLAAYLTATAKRHVIFRTAPLQAMAPAYRKTSSTTSPLQSVAVTGNFWLEKRWKSFVAVPCNFGRQQNGEFVFFREIDASTFVYGIRLHDRRGLWALVLAPGQYWLLETGLQYWGRTTRPTVRVRYRMPSGPISTALIGCATVEELQLLLHTLTPTAALPPIPKEELGPRIAAP